MNLTRRSYANLILIDINSLTRIHINSLVLFIDFLNLDSHVSDDELLLLCLHSHTDFLRFCTWFKFENAKEVVFVFLEVWVSNCEFLFCETFFIYEVLA